MILIVFKIAEHTAESISKILMMMSVLTSKETKNKHLYNIFMFVIVRASNDAPNFLISCEIVV